MKKILVCICLLLLVIGCSSGNGGNTSGNGGNNGSNTNEIKLSPKKELKASISGSFYGQSYIDLVGTPYVQDNNLYFTVSFKSEKSIEWVMENNKGKLVGTHLTGRFSDMMTFDELFPYKGYFLVSKVKTQPNEEQEISVVLYDWDKIDRGLVYGTVHVLLYCRVDGVGCFEEGYNETNCPLMLVNIPLLEISFTYYV